MTALWLLSLIAAFGAGWAAARFQVRQRKAARRELAFEIGNPLDLEPSEFSYGWEAQR